MKARSPAPKWILVDYTGGPEQVRFLHFDTHLYDGKSPDSADEFESYEEAERIMGLSGITWAWSVRKDRLQEWLVMKALQWYARSPLTKQDDAV